MRGARGVDGHGALLVLVGGNEGDAGVVLLLEVELA